MTEAAALSKAVADGELWMDGLLVTEGVHEQCAARWEQLADRTEAQINTLTAATSMPGFGGFGSGAALRAGFEAKAADAIAALSDYASAARQLAQTFRAAGAAYATVDHDSAVAIRAQVTTNA